jgi:arylsulfatase A-like enzyme
MPPNQRLTLAIRFAAVHWILLILIQAADFFGYLLTDERWWPATGKFLLILPLLQPQNLLVAAALGGVAFFCLAWRLTRWLYFGLYCLITLYLIVDQAYYKLFFDHIHLSIIEGVYQFSVRMAMSSFLRAMDACVAVIALLALGALSWLHLQLLRLPNPAARRRIWLAAPLALLAAGLLATPSDRYPHLNQHPLVALTAEWRAGGLLNAVGRVRRTASPAALDSGNADPAADARLAELLAAARARKRPLNLLLIVLESVGSRQLLRPDGLPSPWITPALARMARHAAIFDAVYTVYPGTTRSHIALNTGGPDVTWGGALEITHAYRGPMLARSLTAAGYDTALYSSARLNAEGTDIFYRQAGYRTYYDYSQEREHVTSDVELNSWGAREELTLGLIEEWIDHARASGKPFFLSYLTVATHHPYDVPPGYLAPLASGDDRSRYRNALHYSDRAIGQVIAWLDSHGLSEDTLVAVTGDHGEAFGETHPRNFTHRNFLFEENVRSFLLLYHPTLIKSPLLSHRIGSIGDLMPTLVSLAHAPDPKVPGRNLLADTFRQRPVFFHKGVFPQQWGLRDGRWKFIQEIRSGNAEIYDLESDPFEKNNIAVLNADRVATYQTLCRDWMLRTNQEYTSRLADYPAEAAHPLPEAETGTPGPTQFLPGYMRHPPDGTFYKADIVNPRENVAVWSRWPMYYEDRYLRFQWISPSGKELWRDVTLSFETSDGPSRFPGPWPLEEGPWRVVLWHQAKPALTTRFTVRHDAPVHELAEGR